MTEVTASLPKPAVVRDVPVDLGSMSRVGARPRFLDYLVQLWDFRHFIYFDARARVQSATRKDRLGGSWLILNPVLNGLTYFLIFGLILNTRGGIPNFLGYLIVGVFMYQITGGAVTSGARALHQNRALVQGFMFPRAALPIGVNLREMLGNVPLIIGMLLLIVILPPAEHITWRWIFIIPVVLLQFILNTGVSLILARIIARTHDVTHMLPFILRFAMYGSAVFYSFDKFVTHPLAVKLLGLNPLFIIIDITRDAVLYAVTPPLAQWATLIAWALGLLIVGMVFFWRAEESYVHE